jgi:hypothetical protein
MRASPIFLRSPPEKCSDFHAVEWWLCLSYCSSGSLADLLPFLHSEPTKVRFFVITQAICERPVKFMRTTKFHLRQMDSLSLKDGDLAKVDWPTQTSSGHRASRPRAIACRAKGCASS